MPAVNPQTVFEILQDDPNFSLLPAQTQEAVKPYIFALPESLSELLDQPASTETIFQAKLAYLRYCQENGYVTSYIDSLPDEAFNWVMSREEAPETMEGVMAAIIEGITEILGNISAFLTSQGCDDYTYLTHPNGLALKASLSKKLKAGTLTITDVLMSQPGLIVNNGNK